MLCCAVESLSCIALYRITASSTICCTVLDDQPCVRIYSIKHTGKLPVRFPTSHTYMYDHDDQTYHLLCPEACTITMIKYPMRLFSDSSSREREGGSHTASALDGVSVLCSCCYVLSNI